MERLPLEKQDRKLLVGIVRSVNGEIIFVELDKMPHLLATVITDTKLANSAFKKIIAEMEPRRYSMISEHGVRNIESFNKKVTAKDRLHYVVVVVID